MKIMTNYHIVKKLIDRINLLDHSYHYDIFNILCRHNKSYSRNNNGFFFDFQNLEDEVIKDVINFIDGLETNLINLSYSNEDNVTSPIIDTKESKLEEDDRTQKQKKSNISLNDECMDTLLKLDVKQEVELKPIFNFLDKEKSLNKKTTNNRFTLAKKKYSKPVMQETKYSIDDILVME